MKKIIDALKNMPSIFDRAFELRKDPLLADIYESITDINKLQRGSRTGNVSYYIGIERDRENFRKDRENFARDFGKAFQAAKQKLGV